MGIYFAASLLHFVHSAEFIAFYPNMPAWLSRETVYLAWLVIASVGAAALIVLELDFRVTGFLLLGAYGAFGLDALGHYVVALCSEHTFAANVTIWFEVIAGLTLAMASVVLISRRTLPVSYA